MKKKAKKIKYEEPNRGPYEATYTLLDHSIPLDDWMQFRMDMAYFEHLAFLKRFGSKYSQYSYSRLWMVEEWKKALKKLDKSV